MKIKLFFLSILVVASTLCDASLMPPMQPKAPSMHNKKAPEPELDDFLNSLIGDEEFLKNLTIQAFQEEKGRPPADQHEIDAYTEELALKGAKMMSEIEEKVKAAAERGESEEDAINAYFEEAMGLILHQGFEVFNLNKISIGRMHEIKGKQRLIDLGFELEATLKKHVEGNDVAIYSIYREKYDALLAAPQEQSAFSRWAKQIFC